MSHPDVNRKSCSAINSYMMEVEIFEFVHDIHTCYLEIFKEQEIEEKKISIFHC